MDDKNIYLINKNGNAIKKILKALNIKSMEKQIKRKKTKLEKYI